MASRRGLRRKCISKRNYENKEQAKKALFVLKKKGKAYSGTVVYKCRFGGHWHLGRKTRQQKIAARIKQACY